MTFLRFVVYLFVVLLELSPAAFATDGCRDSSATAFYHLDFSVLPPDSEYPPSTPLTPPSVDATRADANPVTSDLPRISCPLGRHPRIYHPGYKCQRVGGGENMPPAAFLKSSFEGPVYIGNPKQAFNVIFDTGSANFWVPSAKCMSRPNKFCLHVNNRYDSEVSSSYAPNGTDFKISYGSGFLAGYLSRDTLYLGDNLAVRNQIFTEATDDPDDIFSSADFDGLMGLGYLSISVQRVKPVLYNMQDQGLITQKVFSMFVDESGGRIIWGGSDPEFYVPPMQYVNVERQGHFQVKMDKILIGGEASACPHTCYAIIDTGTSLIGGPPNEIRRINNFLGATESQHSEFVIGCERVHSLPSVTLIFGGKQFSVPPEQYILKLKDDDGFLCLSGFMSVDIPGKNMPTWVIGDIFLKKFYVEYDLERNRIGFAHKRS